MWVVPLSPSSEKIETNRGAGNASLQMAKRISYGGWVKDLKDGPASPSMEPNFGMGRAVNF